MRIASIVPTPLLGVVTDTQYNMCLYQVAKQNTEYAEYFMRLSVTGRFVIMDNGAAEGVNPTIEELLPIYDLVQPTEIVLPDVVADAEETLKRSKAAYKVLKDQGYLDRYRVMAVPQGRTFAEWKECLYEMLQQPGITTIGVSKFLTKNLQAEMGAGVNVRLECVDAIINAPVDRRTPVQIHLLGCWDDPTEIGDIDKAFGDQVRGTDSAFAYVFSRAGMLYTAGAKRPDNNEIDFLHGTVPDVELLRSNIRNWRWACHQ